MTTKKELVHVAPVRAGVVLAVLYGLISLLIVPFIFLGAIFSRSGGGSAAPAFVGIGFAIAMPFLYAAAGFLGGLIGAGVYNLLAKWTGGFEIELRDVDQVS